MNYRFGVVIHGVLFTFSSHFVLLLLQFVDDDDWSNDDSDEYDSDELTSDWDSEWETVSETSSEDEDKPSKEDTETQPVTRAEVGQADSPYKESVRQAASLVLQAYNHTEAARQLFSDRRTFVFWVLRRFVAVPDELDTVVDQLGTLLAAAAVSPDYTIPSTVCPNTPNAVASQSSSQCLSPAKPWSHEEESEAIAVTDKLQLTRTVIQQAYHLCHDYRLKKLYTKCDHRELFSQKYVEGILKSIEIDANLDLSHGPSGVGSQQSAEDNHMGGDTKDDSVFEHSMHKSSSSHLDIANFCSIVRNQYVLDPEILVALRLSLMKVLIVPDSMHPFTSTDENWRGRIHYCTIQSDSGVDEAHPAYMLVSSSLFAQLTRYLNVVHNRLLEQLSEFGTQASAWLGEMAPDLLSPADKSAHDESAEFDQCPLVSAPASIEQELSNDKHPDDKALMRRDSRRESRAMITVDSIPDEYREGHVCLSLLGTWSGKGLENWNAESSNLLQLVVSLQGLILNSEPYFNEAGFELCRGAEGTSERSRVYNESVVATLVQSMVSLLANPVPVFETQIVQHCKLFGEAYVSLLNFWATLDESEYERRIRCGNSRPPQSIKLPEFPLAPVSKGFQISVRRHSEEFLRLVVALTQSDG
ncbi:unnamed protein product [Dicrocoelium dendriticum]|nr:unnamed protein product [Dicrocoelium dendriticum]